MANSTVIFSSGHINGKIGVSGTMNGKARIFHNLLVLRHSRPKPLDKLRLGLDDVDALVLRIPKKVRSMNKGGRRSQPRPAAGGALQKI